MAGCTRRDYTTRLMSATVTTKAPAPTFDFVAPEKKNLLPTIEDPCPCKPPVLFLVALSRPSSVEMASLNL